MPTSRRDGTNPRSTGTNARSQLERIEADILELKAMVRALCGAQGVDVGVGVDKPKVPVTPALPIELEDGMVYVAPQRDPRREWKPASSFAKPETAYDALAAARRNLHRGGE